MRPAEFINAMRKGRAGPAYFLRGPDRFLHEECRRAIGASLDPAAREWCRVEIEFQLGRLEPELEGANQMPMLGGHTFLIVSDPEDFKHSADQDYEALDAYLEHPSSFATVVFVAGEPDRRRRLIQLLEKKAEVVEMTPLGRQEAGRWLVSYLRQAGVEIDAALAEEIAAKFESSPDAREGKRPGVNLVWLRTEIEKLLTARHGAQRLERADIDLIVSVREERAIGKLLDAIARKDFGAALDHLRALRASKVAEMLLLWSIGDLVRQALKLARGRESRGPGAYGGRTSGFSRFAGPYSTQEIAPRALGAYTVRGLLQALRAVRRADVAIKSAWKDSGILLEFLIWEIISGKGRESSEGLEEPLAAITTEG